MAEQEEPVRRRVALKIIKLGMDTKQVIARFEAERQALALMDHPNIAKVLDAGATDTGRPYFVMDLVKGVPITRYCDENTLSAEQRVRLFIQVCQAVQHAHQKGVIHRDLKPSNILVADHDGTPVPKIIDFGIAKATTDQRLTDKTLFTALEQFIGTPAYMSPEQAKLSGLDVDTRSDIYSLGVLLYELLTGKTPFEPKRLLEAGLDEIRRTIQEMQPVRPSTRLSALSKEDLTTTAHHRGAEPPRLISLVQGDLDWIVMKCLEKDRARRYETANGLARDIERHLNHEPVVARPPSRLYEFQKTVRRHWVGFAAGTAVFASLLIGLIFSAWSFQQERKAKEEQVRLHLQAQANEKRAQREWAKSEQVAQLLKETLKESSPYVTSGQDRKTMLSVLDRAAARISKSFTNQPEIEAELRYTLGDAYLDLREFGKAEAMHRKALQIRRELAHGDDLGVADSLNGVAAVVIWRTRMEEVGGWMTRLKEEAEQLSREALVIKRNLLGNDHADVAEALFWLGTVLRSENKFAEAETTLREAIKIQRNRSPEGDPELAASLFSLGNALWPQDKVQEAEAAHREALTIRTRVFGEEHLLVAESLTAVGNHLRVRLGRPAEAEVLLRRSVDIRRKLLGNDHPDLALSLRYLADTLRVEGNCPEATKLYQEILSHRGNTFWDRQAEEGAVLGLLLSYLADPPSLQGNWPEVEKLFQEIFSHHGTPSQDEQAQSAVLGLLPAMRSGGHPGEAQALMDAELEPASFDELNAIAWFLQTSAHLEPGDLTNELRFAEKAVTRSDRKDANSLDTLAAAYARAGDLLKAVSLEKEAVSLQKDDQAREACATVLKLYEIGFSFYRPRTSDLKRTGREAEGRALLARALELELARPEDLNSAAWRLATNPDPQERDSEMAELYAVQAVARTGRTNAEYLDTLAAARAEAGDFRRAVDAQKEALGLLHDENQRQDFASRLMLYESGKPYREP
jgi:serine/threonine protein kinase